MTEDAGCKFVAHGNGRLREKSQWTVAELIECCGEQKRAGEEREGVRGAAYTIGAVLLILTAFSVAHLATFDWTG